jgi:hypothetical protein
VAGFYPDALCANLEILFRLVPHHRSSQVDALHHGRVTMVRGNQKATAQAKAQAKADSKKTGKSDLKARGAALKITCDVCKSPMINYTQLKQHYESKHPKETLPPDPNA